MIRSRATCNLVLTLTILGVFQIAHAEDCGTVVSIETHDKTTTRYALTYPKTLPVEGKRAVLVLLPGGGGDLELDDSGCPQALTGNSLVQSIPDFNHLGLVAALVDAPSDHKSGDRLGGFRIELEHAQDLGKVIADVRKRTQASVWLVGSSRGSISAANAASRLSGAGAPDGVVLVSALMSGDSAARKPWVAQTVFDLPLESIRVPILVVGQENDKCVRSPPKLMNDITDRTNGVREQVVLVTGGPGWSGGASLEACRGRAPHGFVGQRAEVAAGIARFIAGGKY